MANVFDAQAQSLGVIEGKLDMLIAGVTEVRLDQKELASKTVQLTTQMEYLDSQEGRIQDLEKTKAYLAGWVAAAGLVGGITGWLASLISHK